MQRLNDEAFDRLFLKSRSIYKWQEREVPEAVLRELADITKMGPTSLNTSPMRVVFITSQAGRDKLKPLLSEGNRDKTMLAPVTAIIAHDLAFYEKLPQLFPARDMRGLFIGKDAHIEATAFRNATMQGAYLMLAARALGLDVGAMSGFDNAGVDREFLAGTQWRSNFLCSIGYGDTSSVFPRLPRLAFDEFCTIV